MAVAPTMLAQMEEGKLLDVRAVGFLNRSVGPDNWFPKLLKLADWDVIGSAITQTRPGLEDGVLPEAVLLYVDLYNAGGEPPPIIAYEVQVEDEEKFRTIDGHQRCTAATRVGKAEIMGYVVTVTDRRTLDFLSMRANDEINGYRNSETDKRRQVEYVLATYPEMTNRAISQELSVSESFVSDIKNIGTTKRRLDALGQNYQGVENTVIKILGGLPDDTVLQKAMEVATERAITVDQAHALVAAVKPARGEATRLEALDNFAKTVPLSSQGHKKAQGANTGGSTRRAPRPYWERLLDEGGRFAHKLTGAPPDPNQYGALRTLVDSINANAARFLGSTPPAPGGRK